jgi:hypothetical protein
MPVRCPADVTPFERERIMTHATKTTRLTGAAGAVVLALAAAPAAMADVETPSKGLETWDTTPLYSDWRMSSVLGGTVYSRGGEAIGTVHDATIGANTGLIETIVVRSATADGDVDRFAVPWTKADINPASGTVDLGLTTAGVVDRIQAETVPMPGPGDWSARALMDLSVQLADSGGAVDDLMFNPAGDLTAYVVDLTHTDAVYALPWTAGAVVRGDEVVTFTYPRTVVVDTVPFVYADVVPAEDG